MVTHHFERKSRASSRPTLHGHALLQGTKHVQCPLDLEQTCHFDLPQIHILHGVGFCRVVEGRTNVPSSQCFHGWNTFDGSLTRYELIEKGPLDEAFSEPLDAWDARVEECVHYPW